MPRRFAPIGTAAVALAILAFVAADQYTARYPRAAVSRFRSELKDLTLSPPVRHDRSALLAAPVSPNAVADDDGGQYEAAAGIPEGALAPPGAAGRAAAPRVPVISAPAGSHAVEQVAQGDRPALSPVASFDGLGIGFAGPQGSARLSNPSDNSLAVGPNYIVQMANTQMAIYTKRGARFDTTGKVVFGPVATSRIFHGFGGACEFGATGDAVVRFDQLAGRWLIVMPIFGGATSAGITAGAGTRTAGVAPPTARPTGRPAKYAMCYAVSRGPSPFGPFARYEFPRTRFPDYPRPAVWPDGYYVPTSSGDSATENLACVADRARMLKGEPATEQCVVVDNATFMSVADLDGTQLPPAGTPAVVMALGGAQQRGISIDSTVAVWRLHVDWIAPALTRLTGPERLGVAPYHYLCDGQLTSCVPQPGTNVRLDGQGDKLMARLTYRRIGNQQSIVGVQSVNTTAGSGGVRWYEFRLAAGGGVSLFQQGTFAPDSRFRWLASAAMDGAGNIGIGYSFGGANDYAGQRFAGRLRGDPLGMLTFHESVLARGQDAQTSTMRWEDYTQTAMDPSDDCTIWYLGDYVRQGAPGYSTKIGAFRFPDCASSAADGTR